MFMTGNEIRKSFIRFFESKEHKNVRSSSLIPHNDPTILFTNAGMNQFKDYFLGNRMPEFKTAVTVQKVMRAGGKHNDLENVGRTDRHHTFFEMLGNFSFGDYFKKEAIEYAWEYLTQVLKLPANKLAVSVFEDDLEAYDIWSDVIGLPEENIGRLGEKDNFWSMGDTGPCGPCSEIHYMLYPLDEGQTVQDSLEKDDGKFLEIWNLVFMQFNRESDGSLQSLPKPSIDTGMGLERIVSVVQNKVNNYDTDLLNNLVIEILKNAPAPKGGSGETQVSARVIADHIRASAFLIADGINPDNEGRGYVLRRIIRRAARHGKELGYQPGFFSELAEYFIPTMREAYPELVEAKNYIRIILEQEERRFSSTLNQGVKIINDIVGNLKADKQLIAAGEDIFKLYDTYGFPVDLAEDILEDHGLGYDRPAFEKAMEEQRQRAKAAQDGKKVDLKVNRVYLDLAAQGIQSEYVGYEKQETETELTAVLKDGEAVDEIQKGDKLEVLLTETPFYAESGGQVGDKGEITHDHFRLLVYDSQSPVSGLNFCKAEVVETTADKTRVDKGMKVLAKVDGAKRRDIEANHTATHLLQASLRTVLGDHVKQAGSLVNEEKLRFDFSHYAPLTKEQINDIETLANEAIISNQPVETEVMEFDQALKNGALAIFGEKYGDEVRVISAGSHSKELCGGCHTSRCGNIGTLKIISEESIAAGIRRIEAQTGARALRYVQQGMNVLEQMAQKLKTPLLKVSERIDKIEAQAKEKDKLIERFKEELENIAAEKAVSQVKTVGNFQTLIMKTNSEADLKSKTAGLRKVLKSGVIMLAKTSGQDKISVILSVSKDLNGQFKAGDLIRELSPIISGRGGGSPQLAQCGGSAPDAWPTMVEELEKRLASVS